MRRLLAGLRSLVYGTAFLALWGWLALQTRPLDAALGVSLPPWARPAGAVVMLLAGAVALLCVGTFVARGRGTPAPFDPPREFVAVGPYRWLRNPMYVGGVLLLAGFGLWHRSVSMAVFAGAFWILAHLFVVLYEEPGLRERFGDRYQEYLRSVNRWIPSPPPAGPDRSPRDPAEP